MQLQTQFACRCLHVLLALCALCRDGCMDKRISLCLPRSCKSYSFSIGSHCKDFTRCPHSLLSAGRCLTHPKSSSCIILQFAA